MKYVVVKCLTMFFSSNTEPTGLFVDSFASCIQTHKLNCGRWQKGKHNVVVFQYLLCLLYSDVKIYWEMWLVLYPPPAQEKIMKKIASCESFCEIVYHWIALLLLSSPSRKEDIYWRLTKFVVSSTVMERAWISG